MIDPNQKTLTEAEATAIVNEAIDLDARSSERLTVAELEDRLESLGVPRTRIREVLAARKRAEKEAEERAREAAARKKARNATLRHYYKRASALCGSILPVVFLIEAQYGLMLDSEHDKVVAAQERVYAALGRQQTVREMVRGADPLNVEAETVGSANRVYVAKNDYDAAVAEYNSDATNIFGIPLVRVFPGTFPKRFPFAREVWR